MKYVITAVIALVGVGIGIRFLKKVKPDWGTKLAGWVVGSAE